MERKNDQNDADLVDLGAATEVTHGIPGDAVEPIGRETMLGLSDD